MQSIKFYVGHKSALGVSPERVKRAIHELEFSLVARWGGVTCTQGEGHFKGELELYSESCTILEVITGSDPGDRRVALDLARDAARDAGQECILVTIQPVHAVFVDPNFAGE